ncbi:MAG: PspC domain-containing protein [Actinomycetota bacterium]|nr:PspC domain-containing protein [Actinomycetota bacterium]
MESTQQQQQQQRPRLERLRGDRAIAGVASGLARYLGIDVAWVRIGFVVSALFGGMGILLYIIGWVAMPEEGRRDSIAADKVGDMQSAGGWIGVALIVLAAVIVLGNTNVIDGELLFAAVLVGAGVLLYRGDLGGGSKNRIGDSGDRPSYEPGSTLTDATPPIESPPEVDGTMKPDEDRYGSYEPPPPAEPLIPDPAFQPRPTPPRESSPLGRFAFATALIIVGIMGVGQSAGWFQPEFRHYAATVFVVFGSALLISSIIGRARWLIVLGLLLTPVLLAMALIKVPLEGGFGDPRYVPVSVSDVSDEYRLVAGELVLDLTRLQIADDEALDIEASVVFGRLEVIVPPDLNVDVIAKVDAGEMFLDGSAGSRSRSGGTDNINIERTIDYEGAGQVDLEVHVGFGELVVYQVAEVSR